MKQTPLIVFGNTVQLVFQSVFYLKNIKLIICSMFFNNFKVKTQFIMKFYLIYYHEKFQKYNIIN